MHTEDEARKLWCPMARMSDADLPAYNRFTEEDTYKVVFNPSNCRCIASECAMWRWLDDWQENGYCGLAGKAYKNDG
jgi:hypothetical protein